MKEILKGMVNKYEWDEYWHMMKVIKTYHIYYKEDNNTIYLDAPLEPKVLSRIRKVLKYNNILYDNLIIGHPEI